MDETEEYSAKQREAALRDQKIRGLRIKNLNYGFVAALAIFVIVLFVVTMMLSGEYRIVTKIADEYHKVVHDAQMVQSASDDLTKDVEFFVMTGERRYMDSYFTEAMVTKRREAAMDDLKRMNVDDSLFQYLEDAVKESMNLMQLEYEAMRYAAEGYGLEISQLPQEIQDTTLPEEANALSPQEKIERAHEIFFGDNYMASKSRITGFQEKFAEEAGEVMEDLQTDGRQKMHLLLVTQWVAIILLVFVGVVLFGTISRMIVYPLDQAVACIASGEVIRPLNGIYEVQYMAHSYNGFHAHSMEAQKRLKQDAERDALTHVLNRRGYQTVIDKLASETFPLALLVFDVDNFKYVNDHYGHGVGDLALQKMANLLKETFRATDITSRIGGDEFTVIVLDVTEENRGTIEEKVRSINRALLTPGPNHCPALSASVGCAFSSAGYNEYVFSLADAKMYEAKQSGGGEIRF